MTWTKVAILLVAAIATAECLTCSTDADCTADSGDYSECYILEPCLQGTCVCMDGYQSTSGTCEAELAIDAACTASSECGDNAECTSSVCACRTAYTAESNGVDCELTNTNVAYGDACTEDDECATSGAYCVGNVCECYGDEYGFIYTGSKCLARSHGDACTSSEACLIGNGLTCNGECECSDTTNMMAVSYDWTEFSITGCVHNDATGDLGMGEACNEVTTVNGIDSIVTDATGKFCKQSLTCGTCPEDTSTYICMESGASQHAVAASILFAIISSVMRNLL